MFGRQQGFELQNFLQELQGQNNSCLEISFSQLHLLCAEGFQMHLQRLALSDAHATYIKKSGQERPKSPSCWMAQPFSRAWLTLLAIQKSCSVPKCFTILNRIKKKEQTGSYSTACSKQALFPTMSDAVAKFPCLMSSCPRGASSVYPRCASGVLGASRITETHERLNIPVAGVRFQVVARDTSQNLDQKQRRTVSLPGISSKPKDEASLMSAII